MKAKGLYKLSSYTPEQIAQYPGIEADGSLLFPIGRAIPEMPAGTPVYYYPPDVHPSIAPFYIDQIAEGGILRRYYATYAGSLVEVAVAFIPTQATASPTPTPTATPTPPPPPSFTAESFLSPNGDGISDVSRIEVLAAPSHGAWSLVIAETGQVVATGTGPKQFDWDGTVDKGTDHEGYFFAGAGTLQLEVNNFEPQQVGFEADGAQFIQTAGLVDGFIKLMIKISKKEKSAPAPKPKPKPSVNPSQLDSEKIAELRAKIEVSYLVAKKINSGFKEKNPWIYTRDKQPLSRLEAEALGRLWIENYQGVRGDAGHLYGKNKNGIKFYRSPSTKSYLKGSVRTAANYCESRVAFIDDPWFNAHILALR